MNGDDRHSKYSFDGLTKVIAQRGTGSLRPPAVVASVFQTGLNLMRDLEQKGVRAVGIDYNPDNPGFRSIYGKSFLCPNPDKEPDKWLAFMLSLSAAMGEKPVLIAAANSLYLRLDAMHRCSRSISSFPSADAFCRLNFRPKKDNTLSLVNMDCLLHVRLMFNL